MAYKTITYAVEDRILTITLNRPEKLNAYSEDMHHDLFKAMDEAEADDNIRVIIVTGEGRAFCAGMDLGKGNDTFNYGELDENPDWSEYRDLGGMLALRFYESTKPMIAAINGPAVGVGITMTLPMDIRLASEDSKMGFVFVRRGVMPDGCANWFLPKLVGVGQSLEWFLSGKIFSAAEARERGLISSIYPADQLLDKAKEMAMDIARNTSAVSVALTRQMVWRMAGADHPMESHKVETRGFYYTGRSKDAKEGIMSFIEKRKPVFTNSPVSDMPPFYPWWKEPEFN